MVLAYGAYDIPTHVVGTSIAGGLTSGVLVAWTEKNDDEGTTAVKMLSSKDHGATFGAAVKAGTFASFEAPDIKIGPGGVAHIVYGLDTGHGSDVGYVWSGSPYTAWSKPVTVNDGPPQIGQPLIITQTCGTSTVLHVVWNDTRLSPAKSPGTYHDVFYTRKLARRGVEWSKSTRVSGRSSVYSPYYRMSPQVAVSRDRLFATWTDRRDNADPNSDEADLYGSGILSGVTCP
jgi:hypothetical protein